MFIQDSSRHGSQVALVGKAFEPKFSDSFADKRPEARILARTTTEECDGITKNVRVILATTEGLIADIEEKKRQKRALEREKKQLKENDFRAARDAHSEAAEELRKKRTEWKRTMEAFDSSFKSNISSMWLNMQERAEIRKSMMKQVQKAKEEAEMPNFPTSDDI
eukprot:797948-Amorphochlora_amoeboformis.AAC.1